MTLTGQGNEVREAQPIGQNDEFHGVQICPGAEAAGVQVFQHSPHAAACRIGKQYLRHRTQTRRDAARLPMVLYGVLFAFKL